MLIEVNEESYKKYFPNDPHPFISSSFITLNNSKTDRIIRLVHDSEKPEIGLIAGIKNNNLLSPFSAPFGGFHFKKENVYSDTVDIFISSLKEYLEVKQLGIKLILPPYIYHQTFNAKCANSLIRHGFNLELPDITSWIDLYNFTGKYSQKNSREYYRQAERNNLVFEITQKEDDHEEIFEIIRENRARFGRPIYMTLADIKKTGDLWPVDFFKVSTPEGDIVASAIFYRFHSDVVYAVFWGDNDMGRPLRAMDYMLLNLWSYYKDKGYQYIDLGISTEEGTPNNGLLRFKETHEAVSTLKYSFNL